MQPIRIEVEITRGEYVEACHAGGRARRRSDLYSNVLHYTGVVALVVGLSFAFSARSRDAAVVLMGVGVVLFLSVKGDRQAIVREGWEGYLKIMEPTAWEFRADGVVSTSPLRSSWYAWGAFERLLVSDHLFLLALRSGELCVFPKRCFADGAAREAFWQIAQNHLLPKTGAFPVLPLAARREHSHSE